MKKILELTAFAILISISLCAAQQNVRIKDVAALSGVEEVQIFGYGLVVGLDGTGDRTQTVFTTQTVRNMLKNLGIELPDNQMMLRNVAAVMVTGTLTPFKRKGTHLDVTVSSLGDATSLEGGTLILTPLQGPDGMVFASAQGPMSTGGYDVRDYGLARTKKNHVMVGRIPDGGIVQREYELNVLDGRDLALSLFSPDFTSAVTLAKAVNAAFPGYTDPIARALDASTIALDYSVVARDSVKNKRNLMDFISTVENVTFDMQSAAKVVMNERTGTIVAGGNVRISEIAVTHGGIKIEITNEPEVVEPKPFTNGVTGIVPNADIVTEEKDMNMVVLPKTTTVGDLASALNSLGVAPRDVISIFQAIKEAGALQAQLVLM